jgi:hypothetical protein
MRHSLLLLSAATLLSVATTLNAQQAKHMKRADVFGPDKLWPIHLKLDAKEYAALDPKGGFGFGFFFPKKDEPKKEEKKKDPDARDTHKNKAFGIEFPWAKGDIELAGTLVKEVGIRYKGNSTYQMSTGGLKRPFKIDINHYHENQKLNGMGGFALGNGAADGTRIREALAFQVFRAAKVPAPRTAFVKLSLTVPDKHDNVYVGVYTLIEPVDKPFLQTHFANDKGMLLKPERIQGLPHFGDRWEMYKERYNPKREPTDAQKKRLIEFTKLVNQADDATFRKDIAKYLDIDAFLRFTAANSLIANLDSFFGLGHNYYLYLNPKTNKFAFIPWDVDLSFGGMGFGSQSDQMDWSIAKPYMGSNKLTERVLAMKEHSDALRAHFKALAEGACSPETMRKSIAVLETTIKDAVAKEPAAKGGAFGFGFGFTGTKKQDLRDFVSKRAESVLAQLDGKKEGKTIAGFGFGGPPQPAKGFGPGQGLVKPIMETADANKDGKLSADEFKGSALRLFLQAGGDEKTPVAEGKWADTINRLLPPPKGFGDFKFPAPPKGFSMGERFAGATMKLAGADKEISRAQVVAGAEKLFGQWDKDKSGTLDEKELADGINQLLPPPPGFGAPMFEPKKELPKK